MCDFQSGDVVVCIREPKYLIPASRPGILVPGCVYNISEVFIGEKISGEVTTAVRLSNPETHWITKNGREGGWCHTLFRRVYRPDVSLISKLLEPVDLGEEAQP